MRFEHILDRRGVLKAAGGAVCSCCVAPSLPSAAPSAQSKDIIFCATDRSLDANDTSFGSPLSAFKDVPVARYLEQEAVMLEAFFDVQPKIFVHDRVPDAYARMPSDGSAKANSRVIFGAPFISARKDLKYGLLHLSAVLAHEMSHVFQVTTKTERGLLNQCGYAVKFVELHADYLTGSYMALRGQHRPGKADEVAVMFYGLGDFFTRDELHHGKKPERFHAFTQGFMDGVRQINESSLDAVKASSEGIIYVDKVCRQQSSLNLGGNRD